MKLSRLSGRKTNDYLRREGRVWRGKTMTIRWLPYPPRHPDIDRSAPALYVGTAASRSLNKSAVRRNRMRRRCREALRVIMKERELPFAVQMLVTPKAISETCAFEEIQKDVQRFLSVL